MGSSNSLTASTKQACIDCFNIFDVDNSQNIDKEEALNHWQTKFGKIGARELLDTVDVNKDG